MRTLARPTRLLVLLTPFLMTGCATAFSGTSADSACLSFKPIHASTKDTTQTKREVIAHNARYNAICK